MQSEKEDSQWRSAGYSEKSFGKFENSVQKSFVFGNSQNVISYQAHLT